jgi:hypothetical protein
MELDYTIKETTFYKLILTIESSHRTMFDVMKC